MMDEWAKSPTPEQQEVIDGMLDALTEKIRAATEQAAGQVEELRAENEISLLEAMYHRS